MDCYIPEPFDEYLRGYNMLAHSYNVIQDTLSTKDSLEMFRLILEYLITCPNNWMSPEFPCQVRGEIKAKLNHLSASGVPWASKYYRILFNSGMC